MTGHYFFGRICRNRYRKGGIPYCLRCGLVALSNDVTRRAMAHCPADDDKE